MCKGRATYLKKGGTMSTSRTEAFSDGVFAIAATLLVLELKVPQVEPGGLADALLGNWPSYATYVVSFLVIGIIWVNHHAVMERTRKVNRPLLFLNLMFLMAVALIPFPTALLADYLQAGHDERLAAAVYGGSMTLMGVTFGSIWAYVVLSGGDLLHTGVDPVRARRSLWVFAAGNPLYVLAIGASLLSATLALAIYALLALFYLFDVLPPLTQQGDMEEGARGT
jgi:TMEM175 potassium channel family protein